MGKYGPYMSSHGCFRAGKDHGSQFEPNTNHTDVIPKIGSKSRAPSQNKDLEEKKWIKYN
jgi:hypothetical protein